MAESDIHRLYVDKIYNFSKQLVPTNYEILISSDSTQTNDRPPKLIGGFIPDLYYNHKNILIIGEAKTDSDVERHHSLDQYESYYNEAVNTEGMAIIIFCVSWKFKRTLQSIMKRKVINNPCDKISIYIIDNLGGEIKV